MIVTLQLDEDLVITSVGGAWTAFAEQNGGGQSCAANAVLGKPLRDFISGDATRMWVDTAITLARLRMTPVERNYRCDSPTEKRFMRMRIVPQGRTLDISHQLVRVEPMQRSTELIFEALQPPQVKRRCSCCNRIEEHGVWYEPDEHDENGFPRFPGPQYVTHVICPVCQATS